MVKAEADPLISIIVPVYNAGEYLEECIDSIISQTITDWELLLVDDGSDDGSGALCDSYAAKDPRIICIHNEHRGPSAARNIGLDNARGEYIAMVDSDDVLLEMRYLEILLDAATETDADLCFCILKTFKDIPPFIIEDPAHYGYLVTSGPDLCSRKYREYNNFFGSPVGKLVKAKRYNEIRFPEDIIFSEDNAVAHRLYFPCQKIALLSHPMYGHRIGRSGQSERTDLGRKIDDLNKTFSDRITYYTAQGRDDLAALADKEKYNHISFAIGKALGERHSDATLSNIYSIEKIIKSMDSFYGRSALKDLFSETVSFRDSDIFELFKRQELDRALALFSIIGDNDLTAKGIIDSQEDIAALFPMAYEQHVLLRLLGSMRDLGSPFDLDKQWAERRDFLVSRAFRLNSETEAIVAFAQRELLSLIILDEHTFSPADYYTLPEDDTRYFLVGSNNMDTLGTHLENRGFISREDIPFHTWESKNIGQIVLLAEEDIVLKANDLSIMDNSDLRIALLKLLARHNRINYSHMVKIGRLSNKKTNVAEALIPYSSLAHKLMSGCNVGDLKTPERDALIRIILS